MLKTTLQTKTVGTLLIEKRKEKGLELKDVSVAIKIRTEYLLALEEGRYEVFRSEVYLTGFLKNYAKFLGIDTEKILAMYRRENERKSSNSDTIIGKLKDKKSGLILTPNIVVTILASIAVLIVLIYLGTYIGRVLKKPTLSLTSPIAISQDGESTYKTDASSIELVGNVEIGSKFTINDQELKLNNFEKFTKAFNLEEGANTFVLKAESQFGRTWVITLVITKEAGTVSISPSVTPTPIAISASMEIVKKDTNITVTVDGEIKTNRLYKVGSTLEFTAFKSFEIKATTDSSVILKINGETKTLGSSNLWEIVGGDIIKK